MVPIGRKRGRNAHLAEKPCNQVAKDDGFVRLMIVWGCGDASEVPQIALPLVEAMVLAAGVKEKDVRGALD